MVKGTQLLKLADKCMGAYYAILFPIDLKVS